MVHTGMRHSEGLLAHSFLIYCNRDMKLDTIKFPVGEFTHTDLAKFNGKSNQTVWARYLWARQIGHIIPCGTRKSEKARGKPQLLWKLNPNPNYLALVLWKPQPLMQVAVAA
jgi:hypothetical protein